MNRYPDSIRIWQPIAAVHTLPGLLLALSYPPVSLLAGPDSAFVWSDFGIFLLSWLAAAVAFTGGGLIIRNIPAPNLGICESLQIGLLIRSYQFIVVFVFLGRTTLIAAHECFVVDSLFGHQIGAAWLPLVSMAIHTAFAYRNLRRLGKKNMESNMQW